MLFSIILLFIGTISGGVVLYLELSLMNGRIEYLEQRVIQLDLRYRKLERDAVKVTFTGEPVDIKNDGNQMILDEWKEKWEKRNGGPLIEGDVKSTSKENTGKTQAPPPKKPPVLGEWQIKNGSPYKYKRKPKTS
jgi:hypothetical protein